MDAGESIDRTLVWDLGPPAVQLTADETDRTSTTFECYSVSVTAPTPPTGASQSSSIS